MRLVEIQAREGRLQVGNVEDAAEKRHEQIGLLECLVQAVLGQILATDQALHTPAPIQSHDGHQPLAGAVARRLDIEVECSMTERLEQTPMVAGFQAGPKKI